MELFHALLSEAYGIGEEEIASLYEEDKQTLKADAKDTLMSWDKNRVSKIKGDVESIKENFYKKGIGEGATKVERTIAERYGLKTDAKGDEFLSAFDEHFKPQSGGKKDLTDDDVKKHKVFLDTVENVNKEWEAKYNGLREEHETFKSGVEKSKAFETIKTKADVLFDSFKPILPKSAEKANAQKSWFYAELQNAGYRVEGDKIVVLDKEGNDLTDGHSNRVGFEKFVKTIADKYFEFAVAEKRDGSGNGKGSDEGKGGNNDDLGFDPPTTEEEFTKTYLKYAGNPAMQAKVSASWREYNSKK